VAVRASERAYETLREDILQWRLEPGTVLGEVEQSERLGVSRTPVREALARLNADGLVAAQGGRGLVVTAVSDADVAQLFDLRQALEQALARAAAAHRDPTVFEALAEEFRDVTIVLSSTDRAQYYELVARFDSAMDAAADNPYLVSALRTLRPHLVRLRRISADNLERLEASALEHLLIVEAVAAGDADLAASATHVHLHQSLTSILATAQHSETTQELSATPRLDTSVPSANRRKTA
jgi:DNA-binding GntR family transcriptional regulator